MHPVFHLDILSSVTSANMENYFLFLNSRVDVFLKIKCRITTDRRYEMVTLA